MDTILKFLEKLLPTGVLTLVGVFLWIQERRMKDLRDDIKELKQDKKEQSDYYSREVERLTNSNSRLDEKNYKLNQKLEELQEKLAITVKQRVEDWQEIEKVREPFKSLLNNIESLPNASGNSLEIAQLRQEIESLREPLKLLEQQEQKVKDWLQDIEELSLNKRSWAEEANEYAYSQSSKSSIERVAHPDLHL